MIIQSSYLVSCIIEHSTKADAWSLAYSSKRLYKIILESNAFWMLLIKEIQNPKFTQKKEAVLRCYKLIGDVKARDLYINIWIMLCTDSFNESPLMPLTLRVALITSNIANFSFYINKFWSVLDQTEKQKISPTLTDSLYEMRENHAFFFKLPEEIKELIPFDPKYFDILPAYILAFLAQRYIESDSYEGIYLLLSTLQSRNENEIELFFEQLFQTILNVEYISIELLEKTIAAMKRKNILLEKYPLICAVVHLDNGLELAKLLVSHGAKVSTEFHASSPINYYLTRNTEEKINIEILDFLEQHGDDFFKKYPIVKSLIETGDYSRSFLSFYMSSTEENIEQKLSNLNLNNWKENIEQFTKVLRKKDFEVKHFIRLIENILLNSEYSPNDDNKIITILDCLKNHAVNLAAWENNGDTLLHMQFKGKYWNSSKLAEYLIDHKVDPLKLNAEGKYALNLFLKKIFDVFDLSAKVRYFKAFRTVIQKMMAIDVPDFDKKNQFLYFEFSDTETLWLASLLGYRKLIESQLKPKDIQEVSAIFVSDDFELITFMINSIKIDNTTTGSFMCYWYQFLEMLVADQDIFIREIIDLILNKLYTDMDPNFFDRRFSSSLETFILLHDNRRITTETFVDIVKKMPTIHNPQSGCAELIIYLQPLTTQQFWDNFKSTNIYVEAKDLNYKFEKTYEPHNKIHVLTNNPLEDILKSKFANELLLPLYELYPDWFKEPIFFNRLYRTLISETDQTLHDKYIEVCNFLLEKFPHNKSEISRRIGSDFFTFYGHFEKLISSSLSLQRHIVSHFFTAEMLNAPERSKPYKINLEILFLKLIQFAPTQEFWDLIKTAIDRDDIKYTEGVTFPTFKNLYEFFIVGSKKNEKVKFQIFEFLWKKIGRNPTVLLHEIVKDNQTDLLEHMISVGHPINHQKNETKNTPLHCACKNFRVLDNIKVLLKHGADVSLKNAKGETAWDIAKRTKNFEIGWLLQESKFHPHEN